MLRQPASLNARINFASNHAYFLTHSILIYMKKMLMLLCCLFTLAAFNNLQAQQSKAADNAEDKIDRAENKADRAENRRDRAENKVDRKEDRADKREDKRDAREDVREALRDAKISGVTPFCITIDRESEQELKDLYGDVGYTIIDDVLSLPERLPNIYRRLTS